jgi:hypothetical protein
VTASVVPHPKPAARENGAIVPENDASKQVVCCRKHGSTGERCDNASGDSLYRTRGTREGDVSGANTPSDASDAVDEVENVPMTPNKQLIAEALADLILTDLLGARRNTI